MGECEEAYVPNSKVLKSGIFKLDQYGFPTGIFALTPTKMLSTKHILDVDFRPKKIGDSEYVQELHQFQRRLENIYSTYITGNPDELQQEAIDSQQRCFQYQLDELIETYALAKSSLEPQLKSFLTKVNKQIERGFKKNKRFARTKKEYQYDSLISSLAFEFGKIKLIGGKNLTKEARCHYISYFMAGVGIEKQEESNAHRKLFDRLWQSIYRHQNPA